MESASQNAISWDDRTDGMYLTVPKAIKLNEQDVIASLQAKGVMNYDWKRIKDVLNQARGTPEFVGPVFIYYQKEKDDYLQFVIKREEAKIKINGKIETTSLNITAKDLEFKLREKGVVYGINWAEISEILKKRKWDALHTVAVATEAINGKDGRIEEKVPIDADAKPIQLASGNVDFKNIKTVRQIKEGEVIAIKIPPLKGKEGKDVFGEPIEPKTGEEVNLPVGKNTVISPDGQQLLAKVGGYLYRSDGNICVGELLTIPNDVNFKTGNIKYSGDVIIYGNVQGGFSVDVKGDVQIEGTAEACDITSRNGNVIIKKGIFGKEKATIKAKGDIEAPMAQECNIICEGFLKIDKSVRNSKIKCGSLKLGHGCLLANNQFMVYDKVDVHDFGTIDNNNEINMVDKEQEQKKEKIREFEKLSEKVFNALVPVEKRIRGMHQMLKRAGGVASPKMKQEMESAMTQYYALKKKRQYVEEKKAALVDDFQNPTSYPGIIQIRGNIFPSAKITMYGTAWNCDSPARSIQLEWAPEGVKRGPIVEEETGEES